MILIVILLFLVLIFLTDSNLNILNDSEEKIVTKIIDGDTIVVEGGETVRLLGVDCDERGKECYGAAKEYIEKTLLGKTVILEKDSEDKDQYGRSLRHVFVNGKNFEVELVSKGYCVARFVEDIKYKKDIQEAEQFAINNKVGCKWS